MNEHLARQRIVANAVSDGRTGSGHPGSEDPLAELARLVGRDDPFRDIFPARQAGAALPLDRHGVLDFDTGPDEDHRSVAAIQQPAEIYEADPNEWDQHPTMHDVRGDAGVLHVGGEGEARDSLRFPAIAPLSEDFSAPQVDAYDSASHDAAPPLHPDLWAESVQEGSVQDTRDFVAPIEVDDPIEEGKSRTRTMIVLAAVVALTAGGLGATFLVRGGSPHVIDQGGGAPTIVADTAPTKVQPPETSNAATGGDGTTALLEKSASDNVANAKVVNTPEQPVDLAQLPKPAATPAAESPPAATPAPATQPQPSASSFPEPRKVKTILIRPDGSVVGESTPTPAVPIPASPGVMMPTAANPMASTEQPAAPPPPAPPVAKPATPKTVVRATTTPRAVPHPAPKPKPIETAAADPAQDAAPSPTPVSSGSYAVQLAAPPSEDEAKSVSARLQKKFADALEGRKPSIHKAESGTKSVYRVRVGNMSQDDAKALCSKLQASGGSCFVAHN